MDETARAAADVYPRPRRLRCAEDRRQPRRARHVRQDAHSVSARRAAQSARPGPVADRSAPSAHGPRVRESPVGQLLRPRPGGDARKLRPARRAADASRAARLAGPRFHRPRLGHQAALPQIVLSATYRQDSRCAPELRERDPENQLLARGPSRRFRPKQIRDVALAASGLLDRRMGGPPVSPYQPGGDLWREANTMSPAYQQSTGKDLYRRSLYSVWKRTAPLPNMLAFDAATREVCTVARGRTNTPLQALVLLNDVQFVEAARGSGGRRVANALRRRATNRRGVPAAHRPTARRRGAGTADRPVQRAAQRCSPTRRNRTPTQVPRRSANRSPIRSSTPANSPR